MGDDARRLGDYLISQFTYSSAAKNPGNEIDHILSLMMRGRPVAAMREYDNLLLSESPLFAEHHKIVLTWLECGEVSKALFTYNNIPRCFLIDESLTHELMDYEEADRFNVSVYPANQPMRERWVIPPELSDCKFWAPGRIINIGDNITIVFVIDYVPETVCDWKVVVTEISMEEFQESSPVHPYTDMFLYMGRTQDGQLKIVPNKYGETNGT